MNEEEPNLGKIQRVELREGWPNEASDLTPWLAEHPELLSETLGIGDLEVKETEKRVGNYRVVAKPNDWSREAARTRRADERSPTKETQLRYWTAFREVLLSAEGPARPQKAHPQNWLIITIGRSGFNLAGGTNSRESWIRAELYFDHHVLKKQVPYRDANAYFHALEQHRESIERELEFSLEWEDLSTKGACRVAIYRECDPTDESDWPKQHEWLADRLNRMHRVLAPCVKVLKPLEGSDADSTDRDPSSSQARPPRRSTAPFPA